MLSITIENSADDEQINDNDNDNDNEVEDDNANANEVQNVIAGEIDEHDPSAPIVGIDSPINANETEAQDFMDNPRVDVQPIDSTMLDEIRRRILDRDLIDEPSLSRPISSDRSSVRGVATSVVNAANSANNTSGLPPIELAEEERFILEEDDTSSDSDSNGSEENDEEREEESNGKFKFILKKKKKTERKKGFLNPILSLFYYSFLTNELVFFKSIKVKMKMKMKQKIAVTWKVTKKLVNISKCMMYMADIYHQVYRNWNVTMRTF